MGRRRTPHAPSRDFPFYDGHPVALSAGGWLILSAATALGFAALIWAPHLISGPVGRWIGVLAFAGLPLAGLRMSAGPNWTALFPRPVQRDVWIGLAFVPVTMLVAAAMAILVMRISLTAANPSAAMLEQLHGLELGLFIASTLPQLLGEELVTVLPFLGLLTAFHGLLGWSRRTSILLAWVISAGLFGILHLSTYEWRLGQVLAVIGASRLVLSAPYLITKNIWASTITHVTHDWLIFAMILAAATFR